jgi:hypothetical protein
LDTIKGKKLFADRIKQEFNRIKTRKDTDLNDLKPFEN